MNVNEIAQSFHEEGYGLVRGVFSPHEITEIEHELESVIRNVVPTLSAGHVYFEDAPGKPIKAIHNLQQHSHFFKSIATRTRLMQIVDAIWPDAHAAPHAVMFFGKAAHSGSIAPPHQDNAFQNLQPPEELVCTIAIDESTQANGALCVQRGSHRLGRLPHHASGVMGFSQTLISTVSVDEYPEVQLCMKPGDICLHHTNTIHYSGPNKTDHSRRQLGISYRTARAKRDEAAWTAYQTELKRLHASKPIMA